MPTNLEIAERIYDDWGRGDFSSTEWLSPDFELVSGDGLNPARAVGLEAAAAQWKEMLSAWEELRTLVEEIHEVDEDCLLVFTSNTGKGKVSGVSVGAIATKSANVMHFKDGKVTKLVAYWDRDRALEDVGLI